MAMLRLCCAPTASRIRVVSGPIRVRAFAVPTAGAVSIVPADIPLGGLGESHRFMRARETALALSGGCEAWVGRRETADSDIARFSEVSLVIPAPPPRPAHPSAGGDSHGHGAGAGLRRPAGTASHAVCEGGLVAGGKGWDWVHPQYNTIPVWDCTRFSLSEVGLDSPLKGFKSRVGSGVLALSSRPKATPNLKERDRALLSRASPVIQMGPRSASSKNKGGGSSASSKNKGGGSSASSLPLSVLDRQRALHWPPQPVERGGSRPGRVWPGPDKGTPIAAGRAIIGTTSKGRLSRQVER